MGLLCSKQEKGFVLVSPYKNKWKRLLFVCVCGCRGVVALKSGETPTNISTFNVHLSIDPLF